MTGSAMRQEVVPPTPSELHAALGSSTSAWPLMLSGLEEVYGPLTLEWRPSELAFGRLCMIRVKNKTLVYLIPMAGRLLVGVVLDEAAFGRAMASNLRSAIKQMLADAKPAAEGRGIRFVAKTEADIAEVLTLAQCIVTAEE